MNTGGQPVTISFDGQKLCADLPFTSERQHIREELSERGDQITGTFDDNIGQIEKISRRGASARVIGPTS